MRTLRSAARRLLGLFTRHGAQERAFDEELESHLAMHVEDNIRAGMAPEEARRQAILKLGGIEVTREAYREQLSVPYVEHLVQDVRYACRQLTRTPGLALTAIATLALGTAAALAIYAFADRALLRPLPFHAPEHLVDVTETSDQIPRANLSYLNYVDWKRMSTVFQSFDIHRGTGYTLRTSTGVEPISAVRVSVGFFRTLGVRPVLGRDFAEAEDQPGAPRVAILSHDAWQKRFQARRDVAGQVLVLDGVPYTVIGVLPPTFHFPLRGTPELWTAFQPAGDCDLRRSCHAAMALARLKNGVSAEAATAEMRAIAAQLELEYPEANAGRSAVVTPLREVIVGDVRPLLLLLLAGAGLLLLIVWVNVVSLLLVRSEARRRELALRSTLGASNGRLVRQFLTEGLVLAVAGTAIGLWLAGSLMQVLFGLIPEDLRTRTPFGDGVVVDARLAIAAAVLALVGTVLFSATPAVRMRWSRLRDGLTDGARGSSGTTWRRVGFRLVVCELAIAMVLLVGAGLLGRSLHHLLNVEIGFRPGGLATIHVAAPGGSLTHDEEVRLADRVVERLVRLPGVEAIGLTSVLPVTFNGNTDWVRIAGRPFTGEHIEVNMRDVSPAYFAAIGAPILRGRAFTSADTAAAPRVAIINRTMARLHFPGEEPIGKRFGDTSLTPDSMKEIVGIVDDIREGPLSDEIWPAVYYPFAQNPDSDFAVVARAAEPAVLLPALATAVREVDPDLVT